MSQIKQLPLLFKLFLKGEHMGFEKWILQAILKQNNRELRKIPVMCLYYSKNGIDWNDRAYPKPAGDHQNKPIIHDEKRQSTGRHDIHGEEIFFGDRLHDVDNHKKFVVEMSKYGDIWAREAIMKNETILAPKFTEMELVK